MTREEVQAAFLSDENLEYHVTGREEGPKHLRPAPGWYPCRLDEIAEDGNVEIAVFTDDQPAGLWITVLEKNVPLAFRKPQQEVTALSKSPRPPARIRSMPRLRATVWPIIQRITASLMLSI